MTTDILQISYAMNNFNLNVTESNFTTHRFVNTIDHISIVSETGHKWLDTIRSSTKDQKLIYIFRVWFSGLCWLIRGLSRQSSLCDRRLLWLREQYMQLYHEDGYCCGPLAADAIRVSLENFFFICQQIYFNQVKDFKLHTNNILVIWRERLVFGRDDYDWDASG